GRVIRGNEAAIKILNLSAQTLGGRDLRTLETGRGRTLSDLIDRVRETGQTGRAEVELVRDGKSFPAAVTVSLAPVMQRARKPGFVVTAQDLTDRKAGEESLRIAYRSLQAAEKQLLETSRLLTVSQMAAGLAHELSHPLTGIKGFAQVALVRVGDDAAVAKELERIVEQADAMRDIMERVAGFSDTAAADRGTVNVNDVAGDIPRLLEALRAASGADISLELADPGPVVSGDPLQLTQAVVAIVANSLESLIGSERDGGKISIRTGRDAAFATVVVEDNGSGVPPEVADRIFEPFFTTKKKQGGTGLGLSMAARIIESHGGAVRVAKGDLGGAAFVVSLPVASPDAAKS
ncbi:MAG: nitrogen regulation protein NR(II), partial [Terriglobia bacterium]